MGRGGAGHEIAHRDALRLVVHDHEVEHLRARVERHAPGLHLSGERAVCAEQKLLTRLAPGVEGAGNLCAAEGAGGEIAGVVAGKGHALGHALVDDVQGELRQAVDVRLARAEVAALDRVVEEPLDAVAVVRVVLGRVDAALGRDAVGAARRVLEAEDVHVVAEFAEGSRGRCACQARADDDDAELALVRGIDQLHLRETLVPLLMDRAGWYFTVEDHISPPRRGDAEVS